MRGLVASCRGRAQRPGAARERASATSRRRQVGTGVRWIKPDFVGLREFRTSKLKSDQVAESALS